MWILFSATAVLALVILVTKSHSVGKVLLILCLACILLAANSRSLFNGYPNAAVILIYLAGACLIGASILFFSDFLTRRNH